MAFPESGRYVVPGALVPVELEVERDRGRYVEPHLWLRHRPSPLTPHVGRRRWAHTA